MLRLLAGAAFVFAGSALFLDAAWGFAVCLFAPLAAGFGGRLDAGFLGAAGAGDQAEV